MAPACMHALSSVSLWRRADYSRWHETLFLEGLNSVELRSLRVALHSMVQREAAGSVTAEELYQ